MNNDNWDVIIQPKSKWIDFQVYDVLRYKDLLFLFVKRDFISTYKQTVLGPLWFFLQPLFTSMVFLVIFGRIAAIPTAGMPPLLFYLSGITIWNYFSACLLGTSNTFVANQSLFGKVFFPRIIIPFSVIVSNLLKLAIQFLLFLIFWFYYAWQGTDISIQWIHIMILPFLVAVTALLGLGAGMFFSSLTTKYRDLQFLLQFGIQLAMYATPVFYPLSFLSGNLKKIVALNPVSGIIETFRFIFTGFGTFDVSALLYTSVFSLALFLLAIVIFNKIEKSFIDTV